MTASIIIAVVAIAIVLFWTIRSRRAESHHLDKLHINAEHKE